MKNTEKNERSPPGITVDVERYEALLDRPDLTRDERASLLQDLWILAQAFVDFAFRGQPAAGCGKLGKTEENTTTKASIRVKSKDQQLLDQFVGAAFDAGAFPNAGGSA